MSYRPIGLLAVLGFALACASHVPQVQRREALAPSGEPRPVGLAKVVVKLSRGTPIGSLEVGGFCLSQNKLTWKGGRVAVDSSEFGDVLAEELEAAGYAVAWDPEAMFEDVASRQAQFLIGAALKDIKMHICYPLAGFGNITSGNAEAFVEVDWQIYSQRTRDVEATFTTQGSTQRIDITDTGPSEPLIQAFGHAAHNLLAERAFADLVAPPSGEMEGPAGPPLALMIASGPGQHRTGAEIVDRSRMSVVTVISGVGRHGSGFMITKNGYVLTNEHVVDEARTVNVKFATGREVVADVIRVHKARDVALIKLEEDLYDPLPLSHSDSVRAGSEVFAIGTPIEQRMGQSVTKGVVSGFRSDYGQRFIQSDVAIQPGNSGGPLLTSGGYVVGIAVQGYSAAGGGNIGLNLFVPIEDALDALAIEPAAREGQRDR